MIEKYLIGHCSPTLASLKTANLMNIPFESMTQLESSINKTNDKLNNKGVELIILKKYSCLRIQKKQAPKRFKPKRSKRFFG